MSTASCSIAHSSAIGVRPRRRPSRISRTASPKWCPETGGWPESYVPRGVIGADSESTGLDAARRAAMAFRAFTRSLLFSVRHARNECFVGHARCASESSGLRGSPACLRTACATRGKVVVAAVASRDVERATSFARDTGVAKIHASYEALLDDPDIDAIYVPLPNNLHATWSIRAADAGKHVLCEKPLAASASEARAVFEAARAQWRVRRRGVSVPRPAPDPEDAGVACRQYHRNLAADPGVVRISTDRRRKYPDESEPRRRSVDGCRFLSRQLRQDGRRRQADSRARGFAMGELAEWISRRWPSWNSRVACWRRFPALSRPRGIGTPSLQAMPARSARPISTIPRRHFHRCWMSGAGQGGTRSARRSRLPSTNGFLAEAESFHDLVRHGWSRWVGATPDESIDIALNSGCDRGERANPRASRGGLEIASGAAG